MNGSLHSLCTSRWHSAGLPPASDLEVIPAGAGRRRSIPDRLEARGQAFSREPARSPKPSGPRS